MNPTMDVRVFPLDDPANSTKAFASVALDDMVAIRGIRVIEGERGLFVAMPQSYDKKADEYRDIAFPLDNEVRKALSKAIRDEYKRVVSLPTYERGYPKPEAGDMNGLSIEAIKLDIQVFGLNEPQGSTLAYAIANVDDLVEIRGIRIIEGDNGLFASMPQSYDKKTEEYHDIAFPINRDLRMELQTKIVEKYEADEKSRNKSLEASLKRNSERAARHQAAPKREVAKSRPGIE